MNNKNQLGSYTLALGKVLLASVGLWAMGHDVAHAQTTNVQPQAEVRVAVDPDIINPAKLKDNTLEIAQRRGVRRHTILHRWRHRSADNQH